MKKLLLFTFLLLSVIGFAQDSIPKNKDLKVGLVLSGGGAKGMAHIGVLKLLDSVGVRVDYVGGTSMGAIVGGLYSSGYTGKEIDSIFKSYDLNELMQDNLPRKAKSFYQKENTEKYALTLPIKNGAIGLPLALSKGQNVFNEMSQLMTHVHNVKDFSKLPIPFFCIATNLENGNEVILEEGFLPEAIKASSALPTLLSPVEIKDKLLTDGGVVNNFPTDIMQKKGVDIIIGVDVQDDLKVKKDLLSAPNILMQIISFQIKQSIRSKKGKVDVFLKPDIAEFTAVSFDETDSIINRGEQIANKHEEYFKLLASKQKKAKRFNVKDIEKKETLYLDRIIIKGAENYTSEYVMGKLGIKKEEPILYKDFIEGLDQLASTKDFKSIQYRFLDANTVEFNLKESTISNFLNISAHYDHLYKTAVLLNFTSKHPVFKNDVFSADLILGDNIRYNIDYFIDNGFHWSYGINTRYNHFNKSIFRNTFTNLEEDEINDKRGTEYNDFTTQLYLQSAITNELAVRLGVETKFLRVFTEQISNDRIFKTFYDNSMYGNAFAEIKFDTYDDANFPTKGINFFANYKGYLFLLNEGATGVPKFNPFTQLKGKFDWVTSFVGLTAHLTTEAGLNIGENTNKVLNFHLGGNNENFINNFTPFYGYDIADLSDEGYVKTGLELRYEIFKDNYISFTGNAARVTKDLYNNGKIFKGTRLGYAAGYGVNTFLGPVQIKYTWSPDTTISYWFFNVGYWF